MRRIETEYSGTTKLDGNPISVVPIGMPVLVTFNWQGGELTSMMSKAVVAAESHKPIHENINAYTLGECYLSGEGVNTMYVIAVQYYKIIE